MFPGWHNRPLGFKLIGSALVFLAVVWLGSGLYTVFSERRILLEQINAQGEALTEAAAIFSIEPLLSQDYPLLDTYVEHLARKVADVRFTRIERADGQVVSAYPAASSEGPGSCKSCRVYTAEVTVRSGKVTVLGKVTLGMSTLRSDRLVASRLWALAIEFVGAFVALALLLWLVLKRIVGDPVRMLDRQARELGQGNLDVPIELSSTDELGRLAGTLDKMRRYLKSSYAEVYEQNRELEREIADRKQVEEALTVANAGLSSLYAVTAACTRSLNRDQVLEEVAGRIREVFQFDGTGIFLFDIRTDELQLRASCEASPEAVFRRRTLRRGAGIISRVAESGKPIIFENVQEDPRYLELADTKITLGAGYSLFANFPIKTQFRTLGTLTCIGWSPRCLTPGEVQLITSMTDQIAIAVENARLYQESRRREEIQGLMKELSQDITSLDIESLLNKLTRKAADLFDVPLADVRILRGNDWGLKSSSGAGALTMPIGKTGTARGRSRWIVDNRRALMIPDITRPGPMPQGETLEELGIRGYAGVPLLSREGKAVGVLRVLSYEPREFTLEEVELLQQLANGTAIAVENAELYEKIRIQALDLERDVIRRKQTEEELREARDEMEQRVKERTSELVVANDQLKQAKDAADAANHAKSQFLANMSHELRTPLHGILSFAGFGIKNAPSAKPEKLLEYFDRIRQSGGVLLSMLNDLLDLAKLESGMMTFEFRPVDLGVLAATVADEFSALATERHLTIRSVAPERKTQVVLDPTKIMQVIRNLVGNAVKFSPKDGTLTIGVNQKEKSVVLSVCDQGMGIPEEELEKVFDKFVQSSKTKTGAGGTGLGLSICREIVHAHRGRIWAENGPEGGAVFSFEIPLDTPVDAGLDDAAVNANGGSGAAVA